jgi:hypothetical protein
MFLDLQQYTPPGWAFDLKLVVSLIITAYYYKLFTLNLWHAAVCCRCTDTQLHMLYDAKATT